jgi:beta-glucosidase
MGAALSRGAGERTIACVKHFAVNTMENARFKVDVQIDDDVLHEVYLPHFRQCLDEGKAESVMSAYNLINGEYCGESAALLNGVLRDIWGYDDVVVTSDWLFGLRNAGRSVQAGLDVEMPLKSIRAAHLGQELRDGLVTRASIDRIVRRQIRFQLKYQVRTFGSTKLDPRKVVRCSEHRDLARKVATQGMVLLKNDDRLLPLSKETKQLLVIGPLAISEQTGDRGSSSVRDPDVVSPLRGLEQQKDVEIVYIDGSDLEEVEDAVQHADAVFLLVGYTAEDEGEYLVSAEPDILQAVLPGVFPYVFVATIFVATLRFIGAARAFLSGTEARMPGGDRRSLSLNDSDAHLAKAVTLFAGNKLVIGVEASGPVILPEFVRDRARSILFTGYGGCQFGNALRDVLFGDAEPSGRLAYGIVESESDLPPVDWNATAIRYTRWWGYRLCQQRQTAAAYPFGYGLGYGRFTFDGARAPLEIDTRFFDIEVQVENQGPLPSSTVVQVYLGKAEDRKANDYERALVGFRRVEELPAGGSALVNLQCRLDPVAHWSSGDCQFSVDAGRYKLFVSRYEGDAESACREVTVSNVTWSTKTSVQ